MNWLGRDRTWVIVETSSFPGRQDQARVVEQGLTRRQASRTVLEWQAASDRNKLLVGLAARGSQLPTVIYTAERPTHDRDDGPCHRRDHR